MDNTYEPPAFLQELKPEDYRHWLDSKAQSHVRRDGRRGKKSTKSEYKKAIHKAVQCSRGMDFYTGEQLKWCLVGEYDPQDAQTGGVEYRRDFALLPTVDHEDPTSETTTLRICGLQTNDCKSDLTLEELKEFCEKILRHSGQRASAGSS